MEVTYELTPEDVWQASLYYRRTKAPLRPIFVYTLAGMISLVCLSGVLVFLYSWLKYDQLQWTLLLCVPAALFLSFRSLPATKKRTLKLHARRPGFLCEHTINISPEWFSEKTSLNDTKIVWTTLYAVEEDQKNLYFFLSKTNAHIIPKRAFANPHEAQTFLDAAHRYWSAAKTRTPVTADDAAVWPPAPRPGA